VGGITLVGLGGCGVDVPCIGDVVEFWGPDVGGPRGAGSRLPDYCAVDVWVVEGF